MLFVSEVAAFEVRTSRRTRLHDLVVRVMSVLIVADLCIVAAILITGGFTIHLLGVSASAYSTFNPQQALWLFVAVGAWAFFRPRLIATIRPSLERQSLVRSAAVIAVVFLVVAAPVLWNGVALL